MLYCPPAVSDFDFSFVGRNALRTSHGTLDERLRDFLGAEEVVSASSWVVLLARLFDVLKQHRGNGKRTQVILARYSCNEFSKAVLMAGLTPIYVDLKEDLTNDVAAIGRVITSQTLAVLGVNNCGVESDNAALRQLCDEAGIVYVEDATYTYLGQSDRDNRPFGTYGTFAILNFSEGKIIPCGGGGLVLNDSGYRDVFNVIRKGIMKHAPRGQINEMLGLTIYRLGSTPLGFSSHFVLKHRLGLDLKRWLSMEPTRSKEASFDLLRGAGNAIYMEEQRRRELLAEPLVPLNVPRQLCGISVLEHIETNKAERKRRARVLQEMLGEVKGVRFFELPKEGIWVKVPLVFENGPLQERDVMNLLGLGVAKQYAPEYPMNGSEDFPNSNVFYDQLYTLPVHRFVDARLASSMRHAIVEVSDNVDS